MNVLSLFDGISVARLALLRANIPVTSYVCSEIDKYAIQISENNWNELINLGDVSDISAQDFDTDIDILIGGSPCQGFSLQGLQKGLEDPRSGLVAEYIRLKNELNPTYFLLENVRMKPECRDFISKELGCAPTEINSIGYTGQSRNRLYWTNIPILPCEPVEGLLDWVDGFPGTTRKGPPRRIVITEHFGCLTASYYKGIRADGRPLITMAEGEFDEVKDQARMLTPEECERIQGLPTGYTSGVSKTQRYKALGNAFTLPVIQHILRGVTMLENRKKKKGSGKTIRSIEEVMRDL